MTPPHDHAPFVLDPRLAQASVHLTQLDLCEVRLQADARWPWLVLAPMRAGLCELEQLSASERVELMTEVVRAGAAVRAAGSALGRPVEKLNVGALGNIVAQLHVHVVGRRSDDPAWPGPVWGFGEARAYAPEMLQAVTAAIRQAL